MTCFESAPVKVSDNYLNNWLISLYVSALLVTNVFTTAVKVYLLQGLLAGGDVKADQCNAGSCRMFSTWYPGKLTEPNTKQTVHTTSPPLCSHAGIASSQIRPPAQTQRCACVQPACSLRESGFKCGEFSSAESELQANAAPPLNQSVRHAHRFRTGDIVPEILLSRYLFTRHFKGSSIYSRGMSYVFLHRK